MRWLGGSWFAKTRTEPWWFGAVRANRRGLWNRGQHYLHRSFSPVCDPQHVPALLPLHLLAVPVTLTYTVLLAMSTTLSTCPFARPPSSSPCPFHARAPVPPRVCSTCPPVSTAWPCLHAPVNLAMAGTCAVLASLPLACARRPTDRTAPACRLSPASCQPAPPIPSACAMW